MDELRDRGLNVNVEIKREPLATALVAFSGYIETVHAREMWNLFGEIEKKRVERIVMDMSDVEYISSAGLALLVSYSNEKKKQWGAKSIVIVGLQESVMKIFNLMGLAGFFYILDSMEDAEREFELN